MSRSEGPKLSWPGTRSTAINYNYRFACKFSALLQSRGCRDRRARPTVSGRRGSTRLCTLVIALERTCSGLPHERYTGQLSTSWYQVGQRGRRPIAPNYMMASHPIQKLSRLNLVKLPGHVFFKICKRTCLLDGCCQAPSTKPSCPTECTPAYIATPKKGRGDGWEGSVAIYDPGPSTSLFGQPYPPRGRTQRWERRLQDTFGSWFSG